MGVPSTRKELLITIQQHTLVLERKSLNFKCKISENMQGDITLLFYNFRVKWDETVRYRLKVDYFLSFLILKFLNFILYLIIFRTLA